MMTQVMGCCGKYVQGYGVIHDLKKHVDWMGEKFLVVASKNRMRDLKEIIVKALDGKQLEFYEFVGECSWNNIEKLMAAAKEFGAETLIGIGGG